MAGDLFDTLGVAASPTPAQSPAASGGLFDALGVSGDAVATASQATVAPSKPAYPVSGPTGSWMTDIPRRVGSALADAATAAVSPILRSVQENPQAFKPGTPATPEEARGNAVNKLGTTYYQPETLGGRVAQSALTGSILGLADPASLPSTIAGSATSELAREAFPEHPTLASFLGFLPGAIAAKTITNAPIKPAAGRMDSETAALAGYAKSQNIPLAPGQISENPFIRYFYSETGKLPFSGADKFAGTQTEAFTRAVSNTMGEDAAKITPEVLQAAKSRIGGVFNDVAARTSVPVTNNLLTELQNVVTNAKLTMSADSVAPVERQAMNIIDTAANNGGNIGGKAYIDLTAKGGPIDNMLSSSDSGIRNAGTRLRGVLDDALASNAHPDDLAALQTARSQWKAMRTIEPLTLRADAIHGATPSTGEISPAALRGAVNRSYKNAAFAPLGQIPLNDLAKVGQRFLKEPPDSGTPTRTLAQHALGASAGLGAMMLGHEAFGLPALTSAGYAASGLAVNRLSQALMRNQMLANRMIAASQNPNGFQFTYPWLTQAPVAQIPFSLAPHSLTPGQTLP